MTEQKERTELLQSIGGRPAGTRVFCIGVGNEVNRPLLSQLADDAGGLAAFVSRDDDLQQKARAFRRKLTRPAVSNLEIEIDGVEPYEAQPEDLPDLFHGAPLRLYGRYAEPGTATVTVRGDLGGERFESTMQLDFPKVDDRSPEIERMWAWHRIQGLLRGADRSGSRERVRDEIVRLGEGFSIVTEYTSFLVLENDAEYERWKIERRNALRFERDSRKLDRLRGELEALRQRSANALGAPPEEAAQKKSTSTQQAQRAPARTQNPQQPRRSSDLFPDSGHSSGGGGALDPLSALLALVLAGAALWAGRKVAG